MIPKIAGNYASEVLAEMEAREKNNERAKAVKKLDKEIKGYMKELDVMNDIDAEIDKLN